MGAGVVTDVGEMPEYGCSNVYLAHAGAEQPHKFHGIVVGTRCGSESRHSHADDACAWQRKAVEGLNGHQ